MRNRKQNIYVSFDAQDVRQEAFLEDMKASLEDRAIITLGNEDMASKVEVLDIVDFAIFLISDNYLHSDKCMLEAVRLTECNAWLSFHEEENTFKIGNANNITESNAEYEDDKSIHRVMYVLFDEGEKATVHGHKIIDIIYFWKKEYGDLQMAISENLELWKGNEPLKRLKRVRSFKDKTEAFLKGIQNGIYYSKAIDRIADMLDSASKDFKKHQYNVYEICDYIENLRRPTEPENPKYFGDFGILKQKLKDLNKKIGNEIPEISMNPKVCVIYTGGSAGEVYEREGDARYLVRQATLTELVNMLPNVAKPNFHIHYYSFSDPINSSNISSKHWISMARTITELYEMYEGFVIIHGSNTMAFSASALSFLLKGIRKTVVLTGSELPLGDPQTDATINIERSIDIAALKNEDDIRNRCEEVCIFYGHDLIRGNRATKHGALDTAQGFYSPNFNPLAVSRGKVFYYKVSHKNDPTKNFVKKDIKPEENMCTKNDNVFILDIYPNMYPKIFDRFIGKSTKDENNSVIGGAQGKAIILRTYGIGGIPDDSDFFQSLGKFIKQGGIVINIAQNDAGYERSEVFMMKEHYKLTDAGVVLGGDMTKEAAYCKLKYLFAHHSKILKEKGYEEYKRVIETDMRVNLRGELSKSAYCAEFKSSKIKKNVKIKERASISCTFRDSTLNPFIKYENESEKNTRKIKTQTVELISIRILGIKPQIRNMEDFNLKLYLSSRPDDKPILHYIKKIDELFEKDGIVIDVSLPSDNNNLEISDDVGTLTVYICSESHGFKYEAVKISAFVSVTGFTP